MKNQELGQFIKSRLDTLRSKRDPFKTKWDSIEFFLKLSTAGKPDYKYVREATAALALERFAAIIESTLTPYDQQWHTLKPSDSRLDKKPKISAYLGKLTRFLHLLRARSNFPTAMNQAYLSLGAYGTAILYVDEDLGRTGGGINYRQVPVKECFLAANSQNKIDTVYREYTLTARQAVQTFGEVNLPEKIARQAQDKTRQETESTYIHAVFPNTDYLPFKMEVKGNMPFVSAHVESGSQTVVRQGGYRVMPYIVSRYIEHPEGDVYGHSPAMKVLDDIKTLNQMEWTMTRAGEVTVNPPLLAHDEYGSNFISMKPGAINYGGVSSEGRPLVVPVNLGKNLPLGFEMVEQKRKTINDAFLITLFQLLQESPQMTATESMYRRDEQKSMLAPAMARQQNELLEPLISRELDILAANGIFDHDPDMPEELRQSGDIIQVQYESPLAKAQRGQDGVAVLRTLESIGPILQMKPELNEMVQWDNAIRTIAESFGAPAEMFKTEEEFKEAMQQMQQQQQQQQQMGQIQQIAEMMNQGGGAARQIAQADAISQAQGSGETLQ